MAASIKLRIVKTADSAANNSSGDNVAKSSGMRSSVHRAAGQYAKFASIARYTRRRPRLAECDCASKSVAPSGTFRCG